MRPLCTLEDYASVEAASAVRFEFIEGVIVARAASTVEHGRVAANVAAELRREPTYAEATSG